MRDFRDAKAMAQTLRDALKPKTSLTQSESLELIAKILGFQNWNILSARIQADRPSSHSDVDSAGGAERQAVHVDAAILDRYVGFYQLSEHAVMTISRDGDQLISRLTGQRNVLLYGESKTKFFAKVVNAQISFIAGGSGAATSLVLHQNGRDVPATRIDATQARRIEDMLDAKLKDQSPSPGTEAALRRFVEGLRIGEPNYEEMAPVQVEAVRQQLTNLHSDISAAGQIKSISFVGVGNGGADVYSVKHEHRTMYWRIRLDPAGKVAMSWVSPGL
jgi:hypothetical protein